jgi:DNA-binding MarR family transcriptional regulator
VYDQPQDSLSEAVWRVARQLRKQSRETLSQWDIAPSQSRAIGELRRHGAMRLRDLSDHLHIAPRSTTEVVDWLVNHGFVQRHADPKDRRATLVSLTTEGTKVAEQIRAARADEAERFFDELSATDRAHLSRILRKLGPE